MNIEKYSTISLGNDKTYIVAEKLEFNNNTYLMLLEDGEEITSTNNHPYYVPEEKTYIFHSYKKSSEKFQFLLNTSQKYRQKPIAYKVIDSRKKQRPYSS